jgi:hypothetical protein
MSDTPCPMGMLNLPSRVPPLSLQKRYRNINLLSIAYAFRPQLRTRLTLRGLTFRRKPEVSGGRVSRTPHATYPSILTSLNSTTVYTAASLLRERSPTPPDLHRKAIASVTDLSPAGFSAQNHSTSELLRTL